MSSLPTLISPTLSKSSDPGGLLFINRTETGIAHALESLSSTQASVVEQNRPWFVQGDIRKSPGLLSTLSIRSQPGKTVSISAECPERGYEPFIAKLLEKSAKSEVFAERIEKIFNDCLLRWAADRFQHHFMIQNPVGKVWTSLLFHEKGALQWLGQDRPLPKEKYPLDLVFDELSRELLHQFEENRIVEGLSRFLIADAERAKVIAERAVARFPKSQKLHKILKLVSPSKVVGHPASGASRKEDFKWIRTNWDRYRGQWVALYRGQCVAAGKDLPTVRNNARKQAKLADVLITFFPMEKDREAIPEA